MASKYSSLSPYNYSFNQPNMVVDVNGADPNGHYFYGSYFTYDDWIPQRDLGWAQTIDRSDAGGRRFGESLSFGSLSYSAAGRAYAAQMRSDAQSARGDAGAMQAYGQMYGTANIGYSIANAIGTGLGVEVTSYKGAIGFWRQEGFDDRAGIWLRFVSPTDGLFDSMDEAAKDWAMKYNDNSIVNNREYGSSIYSIGGKYGYSIPNVGSSIRVDISDPPKDYKVVASIHSHGKYRSGFKTDELVGHDTNQADKFKLTVYVSVPKGMLLRYDPLSKVRDNWVDVLIPSDPSDPFRVNSVSPHGLPKNEPSTSSFWNWFYHFWDD